MHSLPFYASTDFNPKFTLSIFTNANLFRSMSSTTNALGHLHSGLCGSF